ncbi:hypothetical protein [Helicobacter burdigaliensis]|uniref:hypothetical protein n=1 Tax=Helicobacter burdigaliensis TaxID=2315334 RepID=UPI000EF6BCC7|nr:hypothetical protein [Helicobacter burdigaliensis]
MIKKLSCVIFLLVGFVEAKDLLRVLDSMHLSQKERADIKVVLEDYHQEKKVYYKNINRTEELMLLEILQEKDVDFEKYRTIMDAISEDYIEAQIEFYQLLAKKLSKERMKELAQEMLK